MIRKGLAGLAAAAALNSIAAGLAQAGPAALPVLAQVSVQKTGGPNYVIPSLVVAALFGLALFVICKTSRRV